MTADTETISIAAAEELIARALSNSGVRPESAASVARALVAAEAEGQVGHGFSRLSDYAAQARSGKVKGDATPRCVETAPAAAVIDAGHGFAYPALDMAIGWGIDAASRFGTATMSVTRSHHCGALSVQVEKIAQAGLIGIMVANSPAAIAPWGSKVPVFGTNPIAFAVPRADRAPLVIDLSLSRVARGKVMHAKKSGQPIPLGWALDAEGQPTTDANAALEGSMIAIGEAKGTALALMVEVLSAVFTGANTSSEVTSFFTADGPPPGSGQFLMALKPVEGSGFPERLEALLALIADLEGARLPGTRRAEAMARSVENGISVPRQYLDGARALAGDDA
jgi:(2R)-3-sulfolactate dehydrogenase (NADP+)